MARTLTPVTPDRAELLTFVAARPGMWGDDLCGALGWDAGRFWRAVACPLFDALDPGFPAGYRLTEAGRGELAKIALRNPERKPHPPGRKPKPYREPRPKRMKIPKPVDPRPKWVRDKVRAAAAAAAAIQIIQFAGVA